jgi:hypothetical protein
VAASLSHDLVADRGKRASRFSTRNARERRQRTLRSDRHAVYELAGRGWNRVAPFAHVLDRQQDGFARVRPRLLRGLALAVAAWERGHDGDVAAFGIGLENHMVAGLFHVPSLSCPLTSGHGRAQPVQDLRHTSPGNALTPSDCGSRGDLQLAQPFEGVLQRIVPVTGHALNSWFSCRSEIHDDARRKVLTCGAVREQKSRKRSGSVLTNP